MRARYFPAAAGLVVTGLLLTGCSGGDPEPEPTGTGAPTETAATAPTPEGSTPEQLSEQVLAAASDNQASPPIASGGGTFDTDVTLDIEVTSLEATEHGTLLTARFSGAPGESLSLAELGNRTNMSVYFARNIYLVDDAVSHSRYLPLQFTDYRAACVCPAFSLKLGPEPQTVTALFPPLPDGVTSVDLVLNDEVTVPGVPVGG